MRNRILGGAALAVLVTAGCSNERAITTEPVGAIGYGQNLAKTATNLPRGRVNFATSPLPLGNPAADTIVMHFAGLDSLTTGSYNIWVANDSATKFARVTGTLTVTITDTTINEQGDPVFTTTELDPMTGVSSFRNGGHNKRFRFSALRSDISGLAATDSIGVVLISIESGEPGNEPGSTRPLWARRSQATTNVAGLRFGNFMPRLTEEYVYATSTTALIPTASTPTLPRGRIEVRGSIYTVNDSNYFRPPQGYYYEAWAIRADTLGVFRDTISLGVKASPYPNRISFLNADIQVPDPQYMFVSSTPCSPTATVCAIQQPMIWASQHRVSADSIPGAVIDGRPWRNFAWTFVTLENKASAADEMGGVVIMNVNNPGSISGF